MNEPQLDHAIAFDPVVSELPDEIALPPGQGGEIVALLVDPGTGIEGWCLRVARALARGWAEAGRSVVLVDAHVESPSLHQLLDAPNEEGLTDAIEYGASMSRIARPLPKEAFRFISSGTVLAHQREFWRSRRWGALLDGFREADAVVLLYLPAGDPDTGVVLRRADRTFWIGRPGVPEQAGFGELPAIVPASPGDGSSDAETTKQIEDARRRLGTPRGLVGATQDTLARKPEAGRVTPPAGGRPGGSPSSRASVEPRQAARGSARPVGRRRAMPWLLLGLLLVLAGAVIGHWFGVFTIPGLPVRMESVTSGFSLFPLRG